VKISKMAIWSALVLFSLLVLFFLVYLILINLNFGFNWFLV